MSNGLTSLTVSGFYSVNAAVRILVSRIKGQSRTSRGTVVSRQRVHALSGALKELRVRAFAPRKQKEYKVFGVNPAISHDNSRPLYDAIVVALAASAVVADISRVLPSIPVSRITVNLSSVKNRCVDDIASSNRERWLQTRAHRPRVWGGRLQHYTPFAEDNFNNTNNNFNSRKLSTRTWECSFKQHSQYIIRTDGKTCQ